MHRPRKKRPLIHGSVQDDGKMQQDVSDDGSTKWSHLVLFVAFLLVVFGASGCGQSDKTDQRLTADEEQVRSEQVQSEQVTAGDIDKTAAAVQTAAPSQVENVAPNNQQETDTFITGGTIQETSAVGYRLAKLRTAPADSVLAKHGLRQVESKRLILITDSDDAELDQLPVLADQLFDALENWFGKLPPAADGSDFQVLGHVMIDRNKFRAADLMPVESFTIRHGRHQRYAFWAGYPDTAYYRRHLALHEFVHCFMTCESDQLGVPSPWYLEGMAELFGTHAIVGGGAAQGMGLTEADDRKSVMGLTEADDRTRDLAAKFGVMPATAEGFEGWGRIRAFREQFAAGDHQQLAELQIPSLEKVVPDRVAVFETPFDYSSSWAVCWFLANHPDTPNVMPALAKQTTYTGFVSEWQRQKNEFENRLKVDWLLFAEQLDFGFDKQRCFPVHQSSNTENFDTLNTSTSFRLNADRGWQDTGIVLTSGQSATIQCDGRCVVNNTTEPWESSPDGISIDYYRGHRLGQVVGVLVSANGNQITDRIEVGRGLKLTAKFDGRLWLQINDACDARDNNSGSYTVQLEYSAE